MKVDNTQPWIESSDKGQSFGDLLNAHTELARKKEEHRETLNKKLDEVEKSTNDQLNDFSTTTDALIKKHVALKGPAHGETLKTINLENKDNYPAGSPDQVKNGTPNVYVTPAGIPGLLEDNLKIEPGNFIANGLIPISATSGIGSSLANEIYPIKSQEFPKETEIGIINYLLSTESDFLLFPDFGKGRKTKYSQGGDSAPTTTTRIQVLDGRFVINRGEAIGLNDVTISDGFSSKSTGLEFGFGEYRGNFFDSNFHPTVDSKSTELITEQNVEATLFNPTIIYKPNGTLTLKNSDLTQHGFSRLFLPTDFSMNIDDASFLSSDDIVFIFSNIEVITQNNQLGISFVISTGEVGIPDWYDENIDKSKTKDLCKNGYYSAVSNMVSKVEGYPGATGTVALDKEYLPFGVGVNRYAFNRSNFSNSVRTSRIFIPFNALISNFDSLSSAVKNNFVNNIDLDLLKRITPTWSNKIAFEGYIRIPLLFKSNNGKDCYNKYVDMSFSAIRDEVNNLFTINIKAINFNVNDRPTINSGIDLNTLNLFKKYPVSVKDLPFHPKVLSGCFIETGGHITAYSMGHRQYLCLYRHDIKNIGQWITSNKEITSTDYTIKDISTMSFNNWYGENVRFIPVSVEENTVNYLSYLRSPSGEYRTALINLDINADIETQETVVPNSITWIDRNNYTNLPLLIENKSFKSNVIDISALVFSERNNFIGYNDPNWGNGQFSPKEKVTLTNTLRSALRAQSGFDYPYELFFYYKGIMFGIFHSKETADNGTNNYVDTSVVSCRADMLTDGNDFKLSVVQGTQFNVIKSAIKRGAINSDRFGETHESFDDVFIIDNNDGSGSYNVFVNHHDLAGVYFNFLIRLDELGYYQAKEFVRQEITPDVFSSGNVNIPYNFIKGTLGAICLKRGFYTQGSGVFDLNKYGEKGKTSLSKYYMGYGDDLILYLAGSYMLINGKTLNITKTITLPIDGNNGGRVFITDIDNKLISYSEWHNPNGYPTEPDNNVVFCGFLYTYKGKWIFSRYADTTEFRLKHFDFLNANLPVINGIQMATDSLGTTFPIFLGKRTDNPRQYYFSK